MSHQPYGIYTHSRWLIATGLSYAHVCRDRRGGDRTDSLFGLQGYYWVA